MPRIKRGEVGESFGFFRIAAAVPRLMLGDADANAKEIVRLAAEAERNAAEIVLFPELSLTGYTLADLFHQELLQTKALGALKSVVDYSRTARIAICVGLPMAFEGKLFNVAVLIHRGQVLGIVPKTYVPGYKEFYEERWFASARDLVQREMKLFGQTVPVGSDLLFRVSDRPEIVIGVEICEDMWVPLPPSSFKAVAGANILLNLSASNELVGKADYRRSLVSEQSSRGICAYVYASCGVHESTTDLVFGGHAIVAENGHILKESEIFKRESQLIYSDVDISHLLIDRERMTSFSEGIHDFSSSPYRFIEFQLDRGRLAELQRKIDPHPFVPQNSLERDNRAKEIFGIQVAGLAKRLESADIKKPVIGLSGGLDSTLTLLVAVQACELLGIGMENIHVFTMPGFGTTKRTKSNAIKLATALGITIEEISIEKGSTEHLKEIGHDAKRQDVVFENVQARYRTMLLMNKANKIGGIVLGTGDLSEIALGWNTFSGDQISNYNVNASVPKTLVKYLIKWVGDQEEFVHVREIIRDILDTPISPELLRAKRGEISQKTEDIVGPYELHDFFLYHFLRWGSGPRKILFLAEEAFRGAYSSAEIKKWLKVFIERFFKNQWKRSVMPDGPKVGSVSLSPRGDWRMPSDIKVRMWLDELK